MNSKNVAFDGGRRKKKMKEKKIEIESSIILYRDEIGGNEKIKNHFFTVRCVFR